MTYRGNHYAIGGKISIFTALIGVVIIFLGVLGELPHGRVAYANNATTSVTVLNTPPQWDTNVYVQETIASASTSPSLPTNSGAAVNWYASATDSSLDNYYLLLCNNYASPTPNSGAAPTCAGGNSGHLIAVSGATQSGTAAVAATSTYDGDPKEFFFYFGYICDGNVTGPACNSAAYATATIGTGQATSGPNQSPFVVNHRPTFTVFTDSTTSPTNPGGTINWYATSSDADTFRGLATDTIKLFVCKAADFNGVSCGAGGVWATTGFVTSYATATFSTPNPDPKGSYNAFGYVVDQHGNHSATTTSGSQGTNSAFVVNNVAPTIQASSITLLPATTTNPGPLILTAVGASTTGFSVAYTVTDQNSCDTQALTPEIIGGSVNVYRSGYASTSCNTAGNFNANFCYVGTSTQWQGLNCTASVACAGTTTATQNWSCTFPLWFLADATDVGSQHAAENWLAIAQAGDTSFASSSYVEAQTGTELLQFLAYDVSTTTIAYGGLQPGQNSTPTIGETALDRTDLKAEGNVGLDETLYGTDMCPGFPAACSGNATSTIFVNNQRLASSTVTYAFATTTLGYNPGSLFALHVTKSLSTSTYSFLTTYWGIAVPGAITLSGSYLGQNTLIGATSPSSSW